ncbi:hypothetical protein [Chitinimonas lacunae]|uniref:Yip1 domain-containing protein n=1 Tax=Chitinimonas lacunae TaxID=1963018 RepID=A0ABV8MRP1_9NEIS
MRKLLTDAFEIACFRIRPLDHYVYPFWQPMLWLSLISAVPVLTGALQASLPERLLFFELLGWAQVLLLTIFLSWWLRLGQRWKGEGSLFPLTVLCHSSALLLVLAPVLETGAFLLFKAALSIYQVVLLVVALSRATGVTRGHVAIGLLASAPTILLVLLISQQFLLQSGWSPTLNRMAAEVEAARQSGRPQPPTPEAR